MAFKHELRVAATAAVVILVVAFGAVACAGDDDDSSEPTVAASTATPTTQSTTAAAAPTSTSGTGSATTGASSGTGEMEISADKLKFDKDELEAEAGSQVKLTLENKEAVPHNVAIYTDKSAEEEIFVGELATDETVTYEFDAPDQPGEYFFRCDVHPTEMTGTFVVR